MSTQPPPTLHQALLAQLQQLLDGGQAHATLHAAIKDFPKHLRGIIPDNLPYSAWQILEHLRITQRDIVDFSDNASGDYKHLQWPAEYWPQSPVPPTEHAWDDTIDHIATDRRAFDKLLDGADEATLIQPFPWGEGQTLLREALLIADHNAYHVGEIVVLRRLLGSWKK
jgi:hypothetical protein